MTQRERMGVEVLVQRERERERERGGEQARGDGKLPNLTRVNARGLNCEQFTSQATCTTAN